MGERKCTVGRSAMARGQFEIAGDGQAVIFKPNGWSGISKPGRWYKFYRDFA
jgi:hypothetical protein